MSTRRQRTFFRFEAVATRSTTTARVRLAATPLPDDRVLVPGGFLRGSAAIAAAELFQ